MKRKIDAMHDLFGIENGKRCEDCSNLIKGRYHDLVLRKCTVYGATHSEASDWRKKYVACGMFNIEYSGRPIITLLQSKTADEDQPIEGQMTIIDEEDAK